MVEITPLHTKVHLDSGRDARIPNNSLFSGAVQIATVNASKSGALTLTLKVDGNAEKSIEAMKGVAGRDKSVYRPPPAVLYSSLDASIVDLKVSCEVDPSKLEGARSSLLRADASKLIHGREPMGHQKRKMEGRTLAIDNLRFPVADE